MCKIVYMAGRFMLVSFSKNVSIIFHRVFQTFANCLLFLPLLCKVKSICCRLSYSTYRINYCTVRTASTTVQCMYTVLYISIGLGSS